MEGERFKRKIQILELSKTSRHNLLCCFPHFQHIYAHLVQGFPASIKYQLRTGVGFLLNFVYKPNLVSFYSLFFQSTSLFILGQNLSWSEMEQLHSFPLILSCNYVLRNQRLLLQLHKSNTRAQFSIQALPLAWAKGGLLFVHVPFHCENLESLQQGKHIHWTSVPSVPSHGFSIFCRKEAIFFML